MGRWEGIAYVSNSALRGRRVALLANLLSIFVRVFDLGEVFAGTMLVRLPTCTSGRMPDVFVIGRDQRDRVLDRWVEGPPLIGFEYLSEDSVQRDLVEKRAEYEQAGMPEYPVIDARPGRREFLYRRLDDSGRYREVEPDARGRYFSEALPGFCLDPNWFWQDPLPTPERLMILIAPEAYRRYLMRLLEASSEE